MEDRFWAKVLKTEECWLWQGARREGYGVFHWKSGKLIGCHRISWGLAFGTIPTGMQVLHRCDNRLCVNPDHLFLGTQADNLQDAINKGHLNLAEAGRKTSHPSRYKGWKWQNIKNKRVWINPAT